MPAVTVCRKPYGLPIAIAICPTRSRRRVAEPAPVETGSRDLQHREVGIRIVADDFRGRDPPVGQRHLDRRRAAGDVAVSDEVAVRGYEEAGPGAVRAGGAATTESFHAQVGDCRCHPVHGGGDRRRIRVEQCGVCIAHPVNVEQGRTRVAGLAVRIEARRIEEHGADIAPRPAVFKRGNLGGRGRKVQRLATRTTLARIS